MFLFFSRNFFSTIVDVSDNKETPIKASDVKAAPVKANHSAEEKAVTSKPQIVTRQEFMMQKLKSSKKVLRYVVKSKQFN